MQDDEDDKNNGTNKVPEIFQRITLNLKFRADVGKIRADFDIPSGGFTTTEERNEWYTKMNKKRPKPKNSYDKHLEWLRIKYKIPAFTSNGIIDFYVTMNKIVPFEDNERGNRELFDVCQFDSTEKSVPGESPITINWRRNRRPFASLYISDIASKDDVIHYINREWKSIKEHLRKLPLRTHFRNGDWKAWKKEYESQGGLSSMKQKRTKQSNNKKRDERVYFVSLMSREMLGATKGTYKNTAIRKMLETEGIKLNEDNIRQIISRQKKLRNL